MLVASAATLLALPLLINHNRARSIERTPSVAALAPRAGGVDPDLGLAPTTDAVTSTIDLSLYTAPTPIAAPLPTTTLPIEPTTTYPDGTSDHIARPAPIPDFTKPVGALNEEGMASYRVFGDPAKWGPRPCAHPTLRKGTYITVTDLNNGKSTTCLVVATMPSATDHIIELDTAVFEELADTSAGELPVRLTW
ncbi:MAG: septal ring lytic transglycosylase RlpA family protein [Acidimicrobiales bacterium]